MREIKFRAWSEDTKEMIQVSRLYLNENTIFFENGNKALNREQELGFWHKPYILMQYTGLKDKNGVEIYEGDVIRVTGGVFHQRFWEIDRIVQVDKMYDLYMPWYNDEEFEIFGNIHENPELLETKNLASAENTN